MGRIISINGRISSGKDTAGKMIMELTKELGINWEVKKFAEKLKKIAAMLLGDPNFVHDWEQGDADYRNAFLPEWGMTRREFLLKLGTESLRDNFHTDVHVIATFSDHSDTKFWLITDLRFPNEFDGSGKRKAIRIRVNRHLSKCWPKHWSEFAIMEKGDQSEEKFISWLKTFDYDVYKIITHPSETSLRKHVFDYELNNNGSPEELKNQIKSILLAENIIK